WARGIMLGYFHRSATMSFKSLDLSDVRSSTALTTVQIVVSMQTRTARAKADKPVRSGLRLTFLTINKNSLGQRTAKIRPAVSGTAHRPTLTRNKGLRTSSVMKSNQGC